MEIENSIDRAYLLEKSLLKRYLLVPVLSIVTGLLFLLFLYWYPLLRVMFLYNKTKDLNKAYWILIIDEGKNLMISITSLLIQYHLLWLRLHLLCLVWTKTKVLLFYFFDIMNIAFLINIKMLLSIDKNAYIVDLVNMNAQLKGILS